MPYPDWWLATSVARVAELDYDDMPLALYRLHGANLTGGVSGADALRERRKALQFQLWCLRNLPLDKLDAEQAAGVWAGVENKARLALAAADSPFVMLDDTGEGPAGHYESLLAAADRARATSDPRTEAQLLLAMLALDPYRLEQRERLREAEARARTLAALPDPLAGARRFVALVDAEELLSDDRLLRAFAEELGDVGDVTLAVDASRLDAERAAGDLRALIERVGLVGREDIHLVAVVGELHELQRARMLAATQALYTGAAGAPQSSRPPLPTFTPASLAGLRALAA
jgi:hypothetical protein